MSTETLFEFEGEKTGREAATLLRELADGLADGTSVELADGDRSATLDAPDDLSLEIELERETGEDADQLELELEFEWAVAADEATEETDAPETTATESPDDPSGDAEIAARGGATSLARFQVFRDRADEWRWRLVHRNGNVIATSGEGYTRRRNAEKGLRSVMANAPGADVEEEQ